MTPAGMQKENRCMMGKLGVKGLTIGYTPFLFSECPNGGEVLTLWYKEGTILQGSKEFGKPALTHWQSLSEVMFRRFLGWIQAQVGFDHLAVSATGQKGTCSREHSKCVISVLDDSYSTKPSLKVYILRRPTIHDPWVRVWHSSKRPYLFHSTLSFFIAYSSEHICNLFQRNGTCLNDPAMSILKTEKVNGMRCAIEEHWPFLLLAPLPHRLL